MAIVPNVFSPENLARRAKSAAFGFLLGRTPLSRVSLTDLNSFEKVIVQFNPQTLDESVQVRYTRNKIRGLPHEPLDYENTGNWIVETEFYVDKGKRSGPIPIISSFQTPETDEFRKFLMSLCYPPKGGRGPGLADSGPPVVLFNWPNTLVFQGVVRDLSFSHVRFDWKDSATTAYRAIVTWEEVRNARLTSEGVRRSGNIRPGTIKRVIELDPAKIITASTLRI